MNIRKINSTMMLLVVGSLLCGILMIYFGIRNTVHINKMSKGYETVEGYLLEYSLYSEGKYDAVKRETTNDTYRLIYHYMVDGQEYSVATDYGTSFIPKKGSPQEIRYDPNNPSKAIIAGPNSDTGLLLIGVLFTGVPLVFLLVFLLDMERLKNFPIDIIGVVISLLFILCSCGAIYLMTGQDSIKGIVKFFSSSFTVPLLIPTLLIVAGVYLLIKSLFFHRREDPKGKNEKIHKSKV